MKFLRYSNILIGASCDVGVWSYSTSSEEAETAGEDSGCDGSAEG